MWVSGRTSTRLLTYSLVLELGEGGLREEKKAPKCNKSQLVPGLGVPREREAARRTVSICRQLLSSGLGVGVGVGRGSCNSAFPS